VRFAISASADHTLRVWNLTTGRSLYTLEGGNGLVTALALTPDGNHAFWGLDTGKLLTWNSEDTEPVCVSSGDRNWVTSVAVTADGRYAIWASASKTLRVCDLRNPELVRELEGHTELVTEVNAALDDHRVISASVDHSLRIWDPETGQCIAAFSADGPMLRCSIAADGRTITARDKSGRVHVLRLEGLD
jgi:WD40 repeat protein